MEAPVSFFSSGQRIFGMMHVPAGSVPAPGIAMCHGFTGHRIEAHCLFVKTARALCAAGINVLRFDFRGSGESEGRFEDMTISGEISDALVALRYLRGRHSVDPKRVAVLGLSLGGCVAACVAGRDEAVRALVLWAAVATPGLRLGRFRAEETMKRQRRLDLGGMVIGRGLLSDAARVDPLTEVGRFRGDALVVHGGADASVPASDADLYMAALKRAGSRKRIIIRGADHVFSTDAFEARVIGETVRWLRRSLVVRH